MFENLQERLGGIFENLRGRGSLREEDVDKALREIRVALLEADVALPVVKDFIERVRERAVGQEVIKSVSPGQQVVKIVHDAMVEMLGGSGEEARDIELITDKTPPMAYLMAGLQGSGKTTTTAKLAKFLSEQHRKKVLMASLDTQRPAAQEQLATLGRQTGIATLDIVPGQKVQDIAKRALESGRREGFDIVLLDTAGRLAIDEELMQELSVVHRLAQPVETLLVTDAMTGQDAVNTARNFDERLGITGIVLTRMDGDARGGAALSMRAITGKPIKMIGTGEKLDALEPFYPERIAGRILGMGDVVSLVEKAAQSMDEGRAEKMAQKLQKGSFDLDDFLTQLQQMKKMGGAGALMKMLPGMGKMASALDDANLDDSMFKHQEAIIQSMTTTERKDPRVLNASRKRRIASGSGTQVTQVNKLLKQFDQMNQMMKKMRKGGMTKMLGSMMGGGDMQKMMQDPAMAGMMGGNNPNDPLGPNPFAAGADPFAAGGLPPLQGQSERSRKNRKPRPKKTKGKRK